MIHLQLRCILSYQSIGRIQESGSDSRYTAIEKVQAPASIAGGRAMAVGSRLPLSPSGVTLNSWQETGGPRSRFGASIDSMKLRTVSVNRQLMQDSIRAVRLMMVAVLLVQWIAGGVRAEAALV